MQVVLSTMYTISSHLAFAKGSEWNQGVFEFGSGSDCMVSDQALTRNELDGFDSEKQIYCRFENRL